MWNPAVPSLAGSPHLTLQPQVANCLPSWQGNSHRGIIAASCLPWCPLHTRPSQAISNYRWEAGALSDNTHTHAHTRFKSHPQAMASSFCPISPNSILACKGSLSPPPGCLSSQVPSKHLGLGIPTSSLCTCSQPEEPRSVTWESRVLRVPQPPVQALTLAPRVSALPPP